MSRLFPRGVGFAVGMATVAALAGAGLYAGSLSTTAPGDLGAGAVAIQASCTTQVDLNPGLATWNSSQQAFTFSTVIVSGTLTNCAAVNASMNIHDSSSGAEVSSTAEAYQISPAEASAGEFTLTLDTAVDAGVDETTRSYAILLESADDGTTYAVGDTGPGGGVVFYDAGSVQSWGRYLEAAPDGWDGGSDPNLVYATFALPTECAVIDLGTSQVIGTGATNTTAITSVCNSSEAPAAWAADDYTGGGKGDWFIPSLDEMDELYGEKATVGGFETGGVGYWSSSQQMVGNMYTVKFVDGSHVNAQAVSSLPYLRPVRAF